MDKRNESAPPYDAGGYSPQPPQQHQQQYPPQQGVPPQQGYPPQQPPPQQVYVQPVIAGTGPCGNCPACKSGFLIENYSLCGIALAIIFFPIGILCCLVMKERRCSTCGATF